MNPNRLKLLEILLSPRHGPGRQKGPRAPAMVGTWRAPRLRGRRRALGPPRRRGGLISLGRAEALHVGRPEAALGSPVTRPPAGPGTVTGRRSRWPGLAAHRRKKPTKGCGSYRSRAPERAWTATGASESLAVPADSLSKVEAGLPWLSVTLEADRDSPRHH